MRLYFFLAILAAFQLSLHTTVVNADNTSASDVMINKAAEELVATPIQEIWKDIYEGLVRKSGARLMRRLVYTLTSLISEDQALSLTNFIINKLKTEIFQGRVNEKMWKYISMELYYALSDWWSKTPENPLDSAEIGAWLSLINVHRNILVPALRGSKRADALSRLLMDGDLTQIKQWVYEWKMVSKDGRRKQQPAAPGTVKPTIGIRSSKSAAAYSGNP